MDIQELVRAQRAYFLSGATRPYAFRMEQLKKLQRALQTNEKLLEQAMYQDFRKAPMEVYMCETGMVLEEVRFHLKHLKGWMREHAAGAVPREKLCLAGAVWRRTDHLAVELPRSTLPVAAGGRDLRRQLRHRKAVGLCPRDQRGHREAHRRDV